MPDDPRGALRWSLSKVRQLVNQPDDERLSADRERVSLLMDGVEIDVHQISQQLKRERLSLTELEALLSSLEEPFLDGIDLVEEQIFQQWLTAERREVIRLQGKALKQLVTHPEADIERRLHWARQWADIEPMSPDSATCLLSELKRHGYMQDVADLTQTYTDRFRNAGIAWSHDSVPSNPTEKHRRRDLLSQQKIAFCQAEDGVQLAYATVGKGSPIIKAANWLSHLEHDWDAPIWSPLFRELATEHRFIRYDERGNGLSDWNVDDISFESFVSDLEAVVEATAIDRFSLLGISQGAAVSIEYAVRHPERVSCLILFGGYDAGWRVDATENVIAEREAVMTLTQAGWGRDNPTYRQIFSSTFMPSANTEELAWFNEFQRLTTSPENAVRFLSVFGDIDVRDKLAQVSVPTLVIHSLGDCRIPASVGRNIAEQIPAAEFVGLDSDGHLLLGRESASRAFVDAVKAFTKRHA
ncbi:adenylate/guanylate cyclase/hydrolase, alpha/beta fold family protein [Reinekea sp. MED297]|uniref:Adenylate/guanylate cyclase/hydrolase, alpha/beta fold family protein n=2 Tax=Reinekea TaxID=230494 RepID=A4BAT2_9GAMM|nr:adenylate/guanylate cyclase/hydrolase, alpha/beta fold family protein [Reinekea sp. MED297] [Reinekea blandensis MED297]